MQLPSRLIAITVVLAVITSAGAALAGFGQPSHWETGFQQSGTPVMAELIKFHEFLLYIITAIAAIVLSLLVTVILRFNHRVNPTPSRTTNNRLVEVAWTIVPVCLLVVIAIPSFRLLYTEQTIPPADLTIKATGKQWYWSYGYPDQGQFEFDSLMLDDKDRKPGQPRLLAVDNELVVPVNKVVRVQVIGADVIHSFAVPSFGIKIDAVPGRLNETWFKAGAEGLYYGQCSELCGTNHAFMPIAVRVVSEEEFVSWIEQAKKKYARDSGGGHDALAALGAANVD
jgi:cytochrome c oxidase subunit 2